LPLKPACRPQTERAAAAAADSRATAYCNYTARGTPALRFTAAMVNHPGFECSRSDLLRSFCITFHLDDNTLEIAEPPNAQTRTGGARFLPRRAAARPALHDPYATEGPYAAADFTLGALVPVLLKARRGFEAEGPKMLRLLEADEWTLDYMASRPDEFPASAAAAVAGKVAAEVEVEAAGCREELAQLLAKAGTSVTTHELCVRSSGATALASAQLL
jgi:DUF1126 PH-like domain